MALSLPPAKLMRAGKDNADLVHNELTKVMAYRAGAPSTYSFYEEIDTWLGPWGNKGYPLGYGKFYNMAFSENEKLAANPVTRDWLRNTTVRLQELLRDWIVGQVRAGAIHLMSEASLRKAAFDSHPVAYTESGLATVALVAPELIPIIVSIPGAEFHPKSKNFGRTIDQIVQTIGRVAPQVLGGAAAAAAGPAHTGLFARAAQRDQRAFLDELALARELTDLKIQIRRGDFDDLDALDLLLSRLRLREFPDQGWARAAGEVVEAAEQRRRWLLDYYRGLLPRSPALLKQMQERYPNHRLTP
ncbi:MAG: hypothetical protein ACRENP_08265 [Longimicrobiales bacterium]